MYVENIVLENRKIDKNSVIAVTGPMFSGKTETIIGYAQKYLELGDDILCFKPLIDNRYHLKDIVSHSGISIEATAIAHSKEIYDYYHENIKLIIIDEAQFFDRELLVLINDLKNKTKFVIAGLELDAACQPFGIMPQIIDLAGEVHRKQGICACCGAPSTHTYRKVENNNKILIGGVSLYEARCVKCYTNKLCLQETD